VLERGGVDASLSLLRRDVASNTDVVLGALGCLHVLLTSRPDSHAAFISRNGAATVLSASRRFAAVASVQESSIAVMVALATGDADRAARVSLVAGGAVEVCVKCLRLHGSSQRSTQAALRLLRLLCERTSGRFLEPGDATPLAPYHVDVRERLCHVRGGDVIVQALATHVRLSGLLATAGNVLVNVAAHSPQACESLTRAGIVPILADHLRRHVDAGPAVPPALHLLHLLLRNAATVHSAAAASAEGTDIGTATAPSCVRCASGTSSDDDAEAPLSAACVACQCVSNGVVAAVAAAMRRHADCGHVQWHAASVLRLLGAASRGVCSWSGESAALPAVVAALTHAQHGVAEDVAEQCCGVLACSGFEGAAATAVADAVAGVIAAMSRFPSQQSIQQYGCDALTAAARHVSTDVTVSLADDARCLSLLTTTADGGAMACVLRCLASLAAPHSSVAQSCLAAVTGLLGVSTASRAPVDDAAAAALHERVLSLVASLLGGECDEAVYCGACSVIKSVAAQLERRGVPSGADVIVTAARRTINGLRRTVSSADAQGCGMKAFKALVDAVDTHEWPAAATCRAALARDVTADATDAIVACMNAHCDNNWLLWHCCSTLVRLLHLDAADVDGDADTAMPTVTSPTSTQLASVVDAVVAALLRRSCDADVAAQGCRVLCAMAIVRRDVRETMVQRRALAAARSVVAAFRSCDDVQRLGAAAIHELTDDSVGASAAATTVASTAVAGTAASGTGVTRRSGRGDGKAKSAKPSRHTRGLVAHRSSNTAGAAAAATTFVVVVPADGENSGSGASARSVARVGVAKTKLAAKPPSKADASADWRALSL
jgi:hypothetical protein